MNTELKSELITFIFLLVIIFDFCIPLIGIIILYPDGTGQHFNFIDSLLIVIVPEGLWIGLQIIFISVLNYYLKSKRSEYYG